MNTAIHRPKVRLGLLQQFVFIDELNLNAVRSNRFKNSADEN